MERVRKLICAVMVVCMLAAQLPMAAMAQEDKPFGFGTGTPLWEFDSTDSWDFGELSDQTTAYVQKLRTRSAGLSVLTVGGVDALTIPSGEGWSFDAATSTLTLDGFIYENHEGVPGIFAEGDLNINLRGENFIDVSLDWFDPNDERLAIAGILVSGNLNIQGDPDAEEHLIVDAENTMAAIYGYSLHIENCDDIQSRASLICIYGDMGLEVVNSNVYAETPEYAFYQGYNLTGIHTALGSLNGQTYIFNSEVNVNAGLAGIMGVPLVIESSKATVQADGWPLIANNGMGIGVGSEVNVTNTLPTAQFEEFMAWTGCPFLVGIYSAGGLEIYDSRVEANAPHFGVMEDGANILIHGGSRVESAGGCSAIACVADMEIYDSYVLAAGTFAIEEALAYMQLTNAPVPPSGLFSTSGALNISGSEVTVESGFYGLGGLNVRIENSLVNVDNSVSPIYCDSSVQLIDCPVVSVNTSEEMLKEFKEAAGFNDIVGAIMCYNGPVEVVRCENLTAEGTMVGLFSYSSSVNVSDSNVTASGGAYGIAGFGITLQNSNVQADAVWTEEDFAYWGTGMTFAVYSINNSITMENVITTSGAELYQNGSEHYFVDANGNPVTSVTIERTGSSEPGDSDVIASGTCGDNLTWVLMGNGTLTISGTGAMSEENPWYSNIEQIVQVVIEDGVTSISDYAFCEFPNLTGVTIPGSVTSIGYRAFVACAKLRGIYVDESNLEYCNDSDGVLYSKDKTVLIQAPATLSGQYVVLDTVTAIGDGAFGSCIGLTSVTIPESVSRIDDWAFAFCEGLTSVTFEGNAPVLNGDVFYNDGLTAYYPTGNETWTDDVMQNYGGTVTWVAYEVENPEEPGAPTSGVCGDNLTWVLDQNGVLTISGEGAMYNYSMDMPWSTSKVLSVVISDGVTSIGSGAFAFCSNMTSIAIPDSVTRIGDRAFVYSSLCSVTIPASVTSIEEMAFSMCGSLSEITFEGDAPVFGADVFSMDGVEGEYLLTAYYPAGNATWTADVMQDYGNGRSVTWVAVGDIPEYIPGDVTGDGKVNNRDAARILQYLAGWEVGFIEAAADVTGDGKINNRDAARILQYLAGWDVVIN